MDNQELQLEDEKGGDEERENEENGGEPSNWEEDCEEKTANANKPEPNSRPVATTIQAPSTVGPKPRQQKEQKIEKALIEAALFLSSRAMSLEEFRTLTGIGALGYLQSVLEELKRDYQARGSAIEIIEADGKYSMQVRNEHLQRVKQFAQDVEISKGALRTLAYISKHDGILKSDLVKRVGTQAYEYVAELIVAGFLKSHKAGRTSKLTLTEKFRKYFVQQPQAPISAGNESTAAARMDNSQTML